MTFVPPATAVSHSLRQIALQARWMAARLDELIGDIMSVESYLNKQHVEAYQAVSTLTDGPQYLKK